MQQIPRLFLLLLAALLLCRMCTVCGCSTVAARVEQPHCDRQASRDVRRVVNEVRKPKAQHCHHHPQSTVNRRRGCCWLLFLTLTLAVLSSLQIVLPRLGGRLLPPTCPLCPANDRQVALCQVPPRFPDLAAAAGPASPASHGVCGTAPCTKSLRVLCCRYRTQEEAKEALAQGRWRCRQCGKRFLGEAFIDAHLAARHPYLEQQQVQFRAGASGRPKAVSMEGWIGVPHCLLHLK